MGGLFGVASKQDCVFDLFFGTDYHSHLGTRRAGLAVYGPGGFDHIMDKMPLLIEQVRRKKAGEEKTSPAE